MYHTIDQIIDKQTDVRCLIGKYGLLLTILTKDIKGKTKCVIT